MCGKIKFQIFISNYSRNFQTINSLIEGDEVDLLVRIIVKFEGDNYADVKKC